MNKFKNTRRRQSDSSPELQADKRKRLDVAATKSAVSFKAPPPRETPLQLENMVAAMKSEEPGSDGERRLMSQLFNERRRRLTAKKGRRPMTQLRETFPRLFTEQGVSNKYYQHAEIERERERERGGVGREGGS